MPYKSAKIGAVESESCLDRRLTWQPRSLDAGDQAALVDFLTNGRTDCRVEQQRAPFDHPALPLPDRSADLPAVGAAGLGSCP